MKVPKRSVILALALMALAGMAQSVFAADVAKTKAADEALVGSWMGDLRGSRVFFQISRRWDGGLIATTGCIEAVQSALPVDSVALAGGTVRLATKKVHLAYEGKLMPGGRTIDGTMTIGRRKSPLTLEKVALLPGPNRPQTPRGPYPYESRSVHYRNDAAGIVLAGTLTLPKQGGPFPAVLLVAGSGPVDRNEEFAFHRPFDVIADYLTRRGIAVLRADKRGIGESQGDFASCGVKDFAGDALSGLKYLKTLPRIDAKRMGIVGHSEGGEVAPIAATQSPAISFIVSLAGPTMKGFDIMVMQDGTEAMAAGASDQQAALIRAWSARYYTIVRDTEVIAVARKKLQDLKATRTPQELAAYKYLGEVGSLNIDNALEAGFRDFLKSDPAEYLSRTKCPILVLLGGKDCQVPAAPNMKAFEEAFRRADNKDAKAVVLPGLNHLFQRCETGATREYAEIEETISPDALKLMGDWIEAHTKARQ